MEQNQGNEQDQNLEQDQQQTTSAADEAYEKARERVGSGVARAAGAVDGFNEKMEEKDLGGRVSQGIQKTGETTRQIGGTAAEEAAKTKQHVAEKKQTGSGQQGGV